MSHNYNQILDGIQDQINHVPCWQAMGNYGFSCLCVSPREEKMDKREQRIAQARQAQVDDPQSRWKPIRRVSDEDRRSAMVQKILETRKPPTNLYHSTLR